MDRKKFSLVILSVVLIAGILTISLLPKTAKPPIKTSIPSPTQKPVDLCAPFPTIPGEISCEEAMDIALQKYPGKVDYVKKEEVTYRIPPAYKERAKKEMWIIGTTLNSPQYIRSPETPDYTVEIAVDKSDGTIRSVREIHDSDITQ